MHFSAASIQLEKPATTRTTTPPHDTTPTGPSPDGTATRNGLGTAGPRRRPPRLRETHVYHHVVAASPRANRGTSTNKFNYLTQITNINPTN